MQLRRETNIYDDEAVARSIAAVNNKVEKTYGTCTTAAATAAKVVALDGFMLFTGAQITVKFSYANTVASPTLNVNGTGAKPIWARGAAILPQYYWSTSCVQHFTYDGSHWVMENAESQEETYKRLTNNSQNTGLYLENGSLYLNASYVNTGALSITKNGSEVFYANVDTGVVRISGSSISITAGDTVDTAIDNAVNEVKASYGTCSTAAATAAKVVTLSKFALYTGAKISVKFTYANTAASPTLNVNGTGAKTIRAFNASLTASSPYNWRANSIVEFVYDGTYWQLAANYDQQEIFNRLTNNKDNQGIYLSGGNLYINASMINTGTLSASRIYGGTLSLGGTSSGTGGDGSISVYDSSGTKIGGWSKSGISVTAGSLNIGSGKFVVTAAGALTAKNATITDAFSLNGTYGGKITVPFKENATGADEEKSNVTFSTYGFHIVNSITNTYYKAYQLGLGNSILQTASNTWSSVSDCWLRYSTANSSGYANGSQEFRFFSNGFCMRKSNGYVSLCMPNSNAAGVSGSVNPLIISTSEATSNDNTLFRVGMSSGIYTNSSFTAKGTKSRLVSTDGFGERLLYCYETPSPLFGDVGEGVISEDGKCYVWIDSIFAKTVSLKQYQVFLQKYGAGDCWISQKTSAYFIVEGTPNMKFGWEIKAKQADFDQFRLEQKEFDEIVVNTNIDYMEDLQKHITEIEHEREVA